MLVSAVTMGIPNETESIEINLRIGRLMANERRARGISIRQLSRKFHVQAEFLAQCEWGTASPPCMLYSQLMRYYGRAAHRRAAILDLQLQLEKNERRRPSGADKLYRRVKHDDS